MQLFHGSRVIVSAPDLACGKPTNDYGRGFYCTSSYDLACEWATPTYTQAGYCNEYALNDDRLKFFDLDTAPNGALSWIATLMAHRKVNTYHANVKDVEAFIAAYAIDLSAYDVLEGYRADDSYFQIVRAFVSNDIALEQLDSCLRLGNLGRQIVLKTPTAIEALTFVEAHKVNPTIYYPLRAKRNASAAAEFSSLQTNQTNKTGTFFIDILRGL